MRAGNLKIMGRLYLYRYGRGGGNRVQCPHQHQRDDPAQREDTLMRQLTIDDVKQIKGEVRKLVDSPRCHVAVDCCPYIGSGSGCDVRHWVEDALAFGSIDDLDDVRKMDACPIEDGTTLSLHMRRRRDGWHQGCAFATYHADSSMWRVKHA